jgi:hypothetical protein
MGEIATVPVRRGDTTGPSPVAFTVYMTVPAAVPVTVHANVCACPGMRVAADIGVGTVAIPGPVTAICGITFVTGRPPVFVTVRLTSVPCRFVAAVRDHATRASSAAAGTVTATAGFVDAIGPSAVALAVKVTVPAAVGVAVHAKVTAAPGASEATVAGVGALNDAASAVHAFADTFVAAAPPVFVTVSHSLGYCPAAVDAANRAASAAGGTVTTAVGCNELVGPSAVALAVNVIVPVPVSVAVHTKVTAVPSASDATVPGVGSLTNAASAVHAWAVTFVSPAPPVLVTVSMSWTDCPTTPDADEDVSCASRAARTIPGTIRIAPTSATTRQVLDLALMFLCLPVELRSILDGTMTAA